MPLNCTKFVSNSERISVCNLDSPNIVRADEPEIKSVVSRGIISFAPCPVKRLKSSYKQEKK